MTDTPKNALAYGFAFNQRALRGLLEGFTAENYSKRFNGAKCAYWYIGHHALCRRMLAEMLGLETEEPPQWNDFFGMHSVGEETDAWPPVAELLDDADAVGKKIVEKLESMTPEDFAAPAELIASDGKGTQAHRLQFMYWHEGFHLGQIALIRAMLDLPFIA